MIQAGPVKGTKMKKFELNKSYDNVGADVTFVRRTDKCIFDSNGNKHLVRVWNDRNGEAVEYVTPNGQHRGMLFAS
ncbi:MAG: hypothetical protein EBY40_01150 [Marivivens sp.]|nr:hypothetical protein [Marivivens sp.]NBT50002.1 hypothetical protein [Marivivens sp.]NCW67386.1 hypothetical protein [Marivivens sp.]NDH01715.1 hypothetical protein [Marivivens sp.]